MSPRARPGTTDVIPTTGTTDAKTADAASNAASVAKNQREPLDMARSRRSPAPSARARVDRPIARAPRVRARVGSRHPAC